VSDYDGLIARYVSDSGVPFLGVDYRLAPEAQYPLNVKDAYNGLNWLFDNADDMGVDKSRIVVMGDSGGGGIAAAVTHWNRENGNLLPIAKQVLIYPMLDDRNTTRDPHIGDFAVWNSVMNKLGWSSILGDQFQAPVVKPSASPARMEDATGLPPAYIETGELDIFRNEDILYAAKLGQAGISTELHVHPGCPHAFEVVAPTSDVSLRAYADRKRVLQSI
jgi:acetyl esterase/lipase